jgi:membrane protein YdbS with pleckstrin-like domain
MPQPWALTLPLFMFRILMLLWALWLAHSLLKWLRWGWRCFSEGGLWKKIVLRKEKASLPASPESFSSK